MRKIVLLILGVALLHALDVSGGLKEAMSSGIKSAVSELGRDGGFLNSRFRIPLPDSLSWASKASKAIVGERLTNDLIASMNSAAQKAVPRSASIFSDAITSLSIDDAKGLLLSNDKQGMTKYFYKKTSSPLLAALKPIIADEMKRSQVMHYYDSLKNLAPTNLGLPGSAATLLGGAGQNFDLEAYVLQKTLDALFVLIGEKEQAIRENPTMRTSQTLKDVFGGR